MFAELKSSHIASPKLKLAKCKKVKISSRLIKYLTISDPKNIRQTLQPRSGKLRRKKGPETFKSAGYEYRTLLIVRFTL